MPHLTVQVAIVGAGPAGLAAAGELRSAGLRTLLLEECPILGGRAMIVPGARGLAEGLIRDLSGTEVWRSSPVWGIFDRTLAVMHGAKVQTVNAGAILLAVGAREWIVPFPGWTLAGVVTIEAAWEALRAGRIRPGAAPVVVVGGMDGATLANRLAERGIAVTLVGPGRPKALAQGIGHVAGAVAAADGTEAVEKITLADGSAHPCGMLCIESPRSPATELARLAGCPCVYQPLLGGFVPRYDPSMAMHGPLPALYVAGDAAGVDTPRAAAESGRLAARSILAGLALLADAAERIEESRRRLAAASFPLHARAREALMVGAAPDEAVERWEGSPDTIVCPCEAVTVSALQAAFEDGARTPDDLKRWTRCGMGGCQWRRCGAPVMRWLSGVLETPIGRLPLPRVRPPVSPISVAALAGTDETADASPEPHA